MWEFTLVYPINKVIIKNLLDVNQSHRRMAANENVKNKAIKIE